MPFSLLISYNHQAAKSNFYLGANHNHHFLLKAELICLHWGGPRFSPWVGKMPGGEKGYPLQYSCLERSMDCIVHGVTKSWTWLRDFHFWKLPRESATSANPTLQLCLSHLTRSICFCCMWECFTFLSRCKQDVCPVFQDNWDWKSGWLSKNGRLEPDQDISKFGPLNMRR